jgi:hypothetical protein
MITFLQETPGDGAKRMIVKSIKFEAFFFTNKNMPHPPKVKWSNIEYSIKLFFFRER